MNFVIMRFSSLGDVILTTPVCENLKLNYPGSFIYFITKKAYASVFEENLFVDRVINLSDYGLLPLILLLKKINPERIYDLHSSLRSRVIGAFFPSRMRRVKTYRKERENFLKGRSAVIPDAASRYLDVLSADKVKIHTKKTGIFLSARENAYARSILESQGIPPSAEIICVAPQAKWPLKEWSRFPKFFELAAKPGRYFIVTGDDYVRAEKLLPENRYHRNFVKNLSGRLSLRMFFAMMAASSCVISMDSGAAHAATALRVPLIVFFGPTVPAFGFAPPGAKIMEVNVPCRPCHLHGGKVCDRGDRVCMESIGENDLLAAMEDILK
ncbi:glycosyltransferase family 9 protein [bacterium]|nr:glycosyltransferase family 9 protein [bacterium]MBU3955210.1 glycosyltransferase family 9 protein [bacterium]